MDNNSVFLIINSYFIGDILLTNSLVQNIKRIYPNSKVVSLTPPAFVDVAKYQEGVDDVIVWDRKHKDNGFWATLKFALRFPYKHIYASFPIYGMDRPVLLSWLLNAKYILCPSQKFFAHFRKSKYKIIQSTQDTTCQQSIANLLSGITKEEIMDLPIKYNPPVINSDILNCLPENYISLCPVSSRKSKNIPLDVFSELVDRLSEEKKNIVILGSGDFTKEYAKILDNKNCENVINLFGKTSILEVANIIKKAEGMISSDTGLLHFANALETPVVAIFYEENTKSYRPNKDLYNCEIISENQTTENIVKGLNNLLGGRK